MPRLAAAILGGVAGEGYLVARMPLVQGTFRFSPAEATAVHALFNGPSPVTFEGEVFEGRGSRGRFQVDVLMRRFRLFEVELLGAGDPFTHPVQ